MGCGIAVGLKNRYGYVCGSRSKVAFEGSWHFTPGIGEVSAGFRMLVSQEGAMNLSDCISAVEQMRSDLQRLEKDGVQDFNPISADTKGMWGRKWYKRSKSQFLCMGLRDPSHAPGGVTSAEVKTIIRAVIEAVDWAIARFGQHNVVLEIN